jgi:putative peptide zinc metalloprotease protein
MILNQKYNLNRENNNYFLSLKDKIYQINQYYYFLLSLQKDEDSFSVQLVKLKEKFNLSSHQMELISSEFEKFIFNLDKNNISKSEDYIKFKRILINRKIVNRLAGRLKFLFNNRIFIILFPLVVFFNIFHVLTTPIPSDLLMHWSGYLLLVLAIGLIAIIHELGHASALVKCDQKSKEIGIGIYFIFPVFYSKVTTAWLLPRKKKLLINTGGIYFQLIINSLLISIITIPMELPDGLFKILNSTVIYSFSLVIYNLLPFLRQDGYWMYADLFGIHNLMHRANKIHKELKLIRIKEDWPIVIYSVTNWFFRIYLIVVLGRILFSNLPEFNRLNFEKEILSSYFLFFVSSIGLLLMTKNIVKILTNKIKINEGY